MAHLVERSITIHAPIRKVYDFHAFPPHLKLVQPYHLRLVRLEMPDDLREGAVLDFDILAFSLVRHAWRVRLEERVPPEGAPAAARLGGIALRSPFALFRYAQAMTAEAEARTVLTDRIEWAVPYGALGRLAVPIIRRELEAAVILRQRSAKRILEAAEQAISMPTNAADAAAYLAVQRSTPSS